MCQRCGTSRWVLVNGKHAQAVARERLWLPLHRPWEVRSHWCETCTVKVDRDRKWLRDRVRMLQAKVGKNQLTEPEHEELASLADQYRCVCCRRRPGASSGWWRNDWWCRSCERAWVRQGRPRADAWDAFVQKRRLSQVESGTEQGLLTPMVYTGAKWRRQALTAERLERIFAVSAASPLSREARRDLDAFDLAHNNDTWRDRLRAFRNPTQLEADMQVLSVTVSMSPSEAAAQGLIVLPPVQAAPGAPATGDGLAEIIPLRPRRSA